MKPTWVRWTVGGKTEAINQCEINPRSNETGTGHGDQVRDRIRRRPASASTGCETPARRKQGPASAA